MCKLNELWECINASLEKRKRMQLVLKIKRREVTLRNGSKVRKAEAKCDMKSELKKWKHNAENGSRKQK